MFSSFEEAYITKNTPWNRTEPNQELINVVKSHPIKPCKMIEMGCGNGIDSIWFAKKGFQITAFDLAPTAIAIANKKYSHPNLTFKTSDFITDTSFETYDLFYDSSFFHYVPEGKRNEMISKIRGLLNNNGLWLSFFSRKGSNPLYTPVALTKEEIETLLKGKFKIIQLKEINVMNNLNVFMLLSQKI